MLKGLIHVGVSVMDFDGMLGFYTDVIGLRVIQLRRRPDGKSTALLNASDVEVIELICYPNTKANRTDVREQGWSGINHFGFLVDDVEAEQKRLEALGVEFETPRPHESPSGALVAHFWDPEGNRLHLTQIPPGYPRPSNIARNSV